MRRVLLIVALTVACFSWGADFANYATGFENGSTASINKGDCNDIATTGGARTGSYCLSTAFDGTDFKYWKPYATFEVPDGSYLHIIGYAKLASGSGQAYADPFIVNSSAGGKVSLTTSWQQFTASSAKTESDEFGAEARFYRKHAAKGTVLFDDIIVYVSDKAEVDTDAPTAATSASATETTITWGLGSDANTGIQKTLIWKRIAGDANDLQLNNQGIYAFTETDGPKKDQSRNWELVEILDGNATSYSESEGLGSKETYAIVHRDLAYNYSTPVYVTTPDLTTKTLYMKPSSSWPSEGARFAVYCFGDGGKWYDMETVDAGCSSGTVYKAEVSVRYTNVIFCRMKGDQPENNWDNKTNQTGDLSMPATEAGVYDGAANSSDNTKWRTQPLNNCVSGTWLCFVGEPLELTSTSPGATSYQWYHKGEHDTEFKKIGGATSATYKKDFAFEDAGDYCCKTRLGNGAEFTSNTFTVKTLRMKFKDLDYGNPNYGYIDLKRIDPTNASGMIILGGDVTFGFNVTDGVGNSYGNNGTMNSGNCTGWWMNDKDIDCKIKTTAGAFATYTFEVNYSFLSDNSKKPVVTAGFPDKQQQAGKVVYFDNSPVNWTNIHYRVGVSYVADGRNGWTTKEEMSLVPGTTNLYQCLTPEKSNIGAWHIGNNCGWEGEGTDRSIFITDTYDPITDTYDSYRITHSIEFEGAAASQAITIIPQSTGTNHESDCTDSRNCKCYFHKYSTETGMLSHNVEIKDPEHGAIKVSYTDVDAADKSFTSGSRDLAHTCVLTIEATPATGHKLTSLLVNGVSFTSGSTLTLTEDITIKAEFEADKYTVTLNTNEGIILSGEVKEYYFGEGAILPTDVIQTGKDFTGWYADEGLTIGPVTEIPADATGDKEFWAGWKNPPASFQYILGSCYVNKDGMWTAGEDGEISAWRYNNGTLVATDDISISTTSTADQYFHTQDLTLLDTKSLWSTDPTDRTIKALHVGAGQTVTFNLGFYLQATKIIFYAFPDNDASYKIDLAVNINGNPDQRQKTFAAGKQGQWHRYQYRGTIGGEFSITSNTYATRIVVIVEVPKVTITFDANNGSGLTATQDIPRDQAETLNENEFEYDNHFFLGWTDNPGGTGTLIRDGSSYMTGEDATLYAKWEEMKHYTVTLDAGSEAFNRYTTSVRATYKFPMPAIQTLPLRDGYVFDGYYEGENGAGKQYYDGLGASAHNWDKDASATLHAKWTLPCDLQPRFVNTTPVVTIRDGQPVDECIAQLICNFDAAGMTYSLKDPTPAGTPSGCTFEFSDNQIRMKGKTTLGNTIVETRNVTFTIKNNCDPVRSWDIKTTIRILPSSQKPKVAFIVRGTVDGAFDAYRAADAAACNDLVTYLSSSYDITFVNGYATTDTAKIADHYKQYDLLVLTDFLNTKMGYTDSIGTLIDKKPILSFEPRIAKVSHRPIGSTPQSTSPKVPKIKVLCAGHTVFPTSIVNTSDTTIQVLSGLSSHPKAKGLQGFAINEAPDYIFFATARDADNKRDLIVCCERQVVFPARLLIFGLNSYELGYLINNGKLVIQKMIEYLLTTDEKNIADCAMVFDNQAGDNNWSNKANWGPNHDMLPTPYHPTRIDAECHVNASDAHASSVKINNSQLLIEPTGGLSVAGLVTTVKDTRYVSPLTVETSDLVIEADASNNGAFVYGNKESDVWATVQYYSRACKDKEADPVWQYMGIPFQPGEAAQDMYYLAWMCRWTSATTDGIGGMWQWVNDYDILLPFEGYCITQEVAKTYTLAGKLNPPVTTTLVLDNRDGEGYAFAANSWTAPIKIAQMQDEDFSKAEKTIYIYHAGSYADWDHYNETNSTVATLPGQYAAVPIHSSPYLTDADSVISPMQGFFIKTEATDAKLNLVYNRTVYDAKTFKTSTMPMRAPSIRPEVMMLTVSGNTFGDRVHLLARNDFSEAFQDGWDGRKLEGDANAPMLAVVKEAGDMAVAAVETMDERELSFRAGSDTEYTFGFRYEGETIYLYDRLTGEATEIKTGNTYSFTAENKTAVKRFLITKDPRRIPTDIDNVQGDDVQGTNAEKCIIDGLLYIIKDNRFYDARGVRVTSLKRKEVAP